MSTTLSAHEKRISQIFSDEFEFNIPSYQRPYAWNQQQAGELFDDLLDFMRAQPGTVGDIAPYFLGSIVVIKEDGAPTADVVDGQQRLTTLTILLAALRAHLPVERAAEITTFIYQPGSMIAGLQNRYRLHVRERDQPFFQDHVQHAEGFTKLVAGTSQLNDSQSRIRDNAKLFNERLKDIADDERTRMAAFVATRCFLVVVSTPDLESAYRIFSVMNSRGLDLTASDILKAQLIGALPSSERDAYTTKWEAAEEDLGRDAFVDLFGHIRMIYRKAKPKATLLKEFEEHVGRERDPRDVIGTIIVPLAKTYQELIDASYTSTADASAVNESLRWLNRLEFSDWLPPALAFAHTNSEDVEQMARFFSDMERLAYAMLIGRWGVNDRIERFSAVTQAIKTGLLYSPDSPLLLREAEKGRVRALLDGPIYELMSARARSTVLLRLDALLSGGGASYDHPVVTVEHILPQNPAPQSVWLDWFPERELREHWTHRLGNLALLTRKKNSAASNYEFDKKKTAYFTLGGVSPFALTTQVVGNAVWTPEVVASRQSALVNLLTQHWRLD